MMTNVLTILCIILTQPVGTLTMKLNDHGEKIYMQTDVENVLIRTDFAQPRAILTALNKQIIIAKRTNIVNNAAVLGSDTISGQNANFNDFKIFNDLERRVQRVELRLNNTFLGGDFEQNFNKGKRAIEFLGDIFSGITGVPSASDYRLVLEQMKLLKLDQDGINELMSRTNRAQKQFLSTLHIHEDAMHAINTDLMKIQEHLSVSDNKLSRILYQLSFGQKINYALEKVEEFIDHADNILLQGKIGHLSKYAIEQSELTKIIRKVTRKHLHNSPVYSEKNVAKYYTLETSHSWHSKNDDAVFTIMQIPLVNFESQQELLILPTSLTLHPELDIAVIDKLANSYRFLSDNEFKECLEVNDNFVCRKREIAIFPPSNCKISNKNFSCNDWRKLVIHDLKNEAIIIMANSTMNATLSCKGRQKRSVRLPLNGIFRLRKDCELVNESFKIAAEKTAISSKTNSQDLEFTQAAWESLTAFTLVSKNELKQVIDLSDSKLNRTLAYLNETDILIKELSKDSKDRWDNLAQPLTGTEKLLMWIAISANFILLTLIGVITTIKSCKSSVPNLNIGIPLHQQADNIQMDLERRMVDLEAGLELTEAKLSQMTKDNHNSIPEQEQSVNVADTFAIQVTNQE